MKKNCFFLICLFVGFSCEAETAICDKGESATLFYTSDCATINGYVTLENSNKTYVFQHEIEEEFQESKIVFVSPMRLNVETSL